ncbi:UDP-N-acetylmuramate dehydrogenase [Stygiobacter electus]|uniref:UDP-N-acetylenolpyruvoylglucosamine reductase n=1 Tax=Stygiobacter electus TaxID=3032292 RepID=A0AAE3TEG7_9BACT|nr:UDP-N-acetylmuramate dehydrogenase [Stygiobacter electus]MDF1612392.1 UDP-N-acetylmuramate dehydrogenase [Stygiobacter electus]
MIKTNINLKNYNTFRVEAVAKFYTELNNIKDLDFLLSNIQNYSSKIFLGGGSNILFINDFNGLVIKNNLTGIEIEHENDEQVIVSAYSGEVWDNLVSFCVKNNFYGIENLTAIPGTVGAAPVQNIGAYGTEFKDIFYSLEGYSFTKNNFITFYKNDCEFDYRKSIFKKLRNDFFIVKVKLILSKKKKFNLEYKSLKNALSNFTEDELNLQIVSQTIREIRNSKLPDYNFLGNAGSFFKNPEVDKNTFLNLVAKYPDISYFQTDSGYKISAGWLIEKVGYKGKREGDVGCYDKQALVLINYGNATGNEILNFAKKIQNEVFEKFDISLEPEVNIIQ